MPVVVKQYNNLTQKSLSDQLAQLYEYSPEFADGETAVHELRLAMTHGDTVFVAEFNGKLIAAVWSRGQGDTRKLQYIVTHPANRDRGVAQSMVRDVCAVEMGNGVSHFHPGCGAIHRILSNLNNLSSTYQPVVTHV